MHLLAGVATCFGDVASDAVVNRHEMSALIDRSAYFQFALENFSFMVVDDLQQLNPFCLRLNFSGGDIAFSHIEQ